MGQRINLGHGASVDEDELDLSASRAGGPGGQGVNTTSSRIELRWNVGASGLSPAQKDRVRDRLANRITNDDELVLHAAEERSQHQNRTAAIARFRALVGEAIAPPKRRRKTRVPRSQKRKRLEDKRRRGEKKRLRRSPRKDR